MAESRPTFHSTNSTLNPTHRARKRFGQNFLVDDHIIGQIVDAIQPTPEDTIVEIGPGQGALTGLLLANCPDLQVLELDRDLVALLQDKFRGHPGLRIHQGDALKTDFEQFRQNGQPLRIVGNLPYNISTPLIFHLLEFISKNRAQHSANTAAKGGYAVRDMHFMLQKEVVDRLAASPGQKNYGRLSVMVQYHCQVQALIAVPPHAFQPAPKVDSAVVRLVPYEQPPFAATNITLLRQLVSACFQQRRKTLRNTLKNLVDPEQLKQLKTDLSVRPETLSVADFVHLSNLLAHDN